MRAHVFIGAGTLILVAGCTFIATFDDEPDASVRRGGDDDDAVRDSGKKGTSSSSSSSSSSGGESSSSSSSSASSSSSGAPEKFPPDPDPAFDLSGINCGTKLTRPNCATNFVGNGAAIPATVKPDDLIDCTGGTPKSIKHCPRGCAVLKDGFADECDDCQGRKNGTYCGKQFTNWPASLADLAVDCEDNRRAPGDNNARSSVCGVGNCVDPCPRAADTHQPACCK